MECELTGNVLVEMVSRSVDVPVAIFLPFTVAIEHEIFESIR